jgi:hypothetical protein
MEHYELRSRGKQQLPGECQDTSGASAGYDSGRAASDSLLNRRTRIWSPENNNPDTASVQTTTPSQSALPSPQAATTKTGKPRLRTKWTDDMNIDLTRCYYNVTEGDTITIGYRQELHREFTTVYPLFTHLTERLMDQKIS